MIVGKFPLRGPLATWLGHLATGGVSEDQPSRRCVGSSLPGTLAPSPGHQWKRAARRARNMVPQLRNYVATIGLFHKGIITPRILPNKLTGISSALLGPFSRLGRYWEGRCRLIETLCIDDHIALSIERFRDTGRRPSPATSMMNSCSAVHKRAGATGTVHKQVRDAGRATVLGNLLDGNRGTLSPFPFSRSCRCTSESPDRCLATDQPSPACHAPGLLDFDPHVRASSDGVLQDPQQPVRLWNRQRGS